METRTYFAISIFKTRTLWLNVIGGALEILQYSELIPLYPAFLTTERRLAIILVLNVILRRFTERPSRVIRPGGVQPVEVKMLHDTQKPVEEPVVFDKRPVSTESISIENVIDKENPK